MTPGRGRLLALAVLALLAGGVLLAASQPWAEEPGTGPTRDAPTAVLAIGLAMLALVGALAIAGRLMRMVLLVLGALLAACVVLVVLVAGEWATAWPVVAIVAAALTIVATPIVAIASRRWPVAASRYSRTRIAGQGDAVADWDALSEGEDPTDDGGRAEEPDPPR